jgi:hypothetical protein
MKEEARDEWRKKNESVGDVGKIPSNFEKAY